MRHTELKPQQQKSNSMILTGKATTSQPSTSKQELKPQQQKSNSRILTGKATTSQPSTSKQDVQQSATQKIFGTTAPISTAEPKPADLVRTTELSKLLESFDLFESETELNHRIEILAKLNTLVKRWIYEVSIAKNMPKRAAKKLGGKICTFGSYRLGVHSKCADIDVLCVAPRNIERFDYFTSFLDMLRKQPEVTECRAIEEAFVPVIKMKFDRIEIDLLFARLSLKEIPDDLDLSDNSLMKNLDVHSVRSLNGFRVTNQMLNLVPNIENFRLVLRTIKLWAKKHGVYSNTFGYFGGVTWAMLVARTCQLYPNATASTLVHKFFFVFSTWKWPNPVLLTHLENTDFGFPVWNPRINAGDRYHLMPVITPAYPQQNSTFNVSESTKNVMLHEIDRGMAVTEEIIMGTATWNKLFEEPSFFYRYRHFLALLVSSQNSDDQLEWCGLVESKVRLLVRFIERHQHISLAHVNPKCFHLNQSKTSTAPNTITTKGTSVNNIKSATTDLETSRPISLWFIGLEFQRPDNLNVDLTENIQKFTGLVQSHAVKIKLLKDGMSIETRHVKRNQLSQYLDEDLLKRERQLMKISNNLNNLNSERQLMKTSNNLNNAATTSKKRTPEDQLGGQAKRQRYVYAG